MEATKALFNNLIFKIVFFLLITLAICPIIFYWIHFNDKPFSDKNLDWAQFGTYLSGTFSPVVALTGAVLTFTIGFVSFRHNQTLLERQEREKRPLVNISYMDRDDEIRITIHNKGLGPLIVTDYKITNSKTKEIKKGIYDWILSLPCVYGNYTGDQTNLVLKEGESRNLLKLSGSADDETFIKNRNRLRAILGKLVVNIEYKDIYDKSMPSYEKSLGWFDRFDMEARDDEAT